MKCGNLILAEKGSFFYIQQAINNEIKADFCQAQGPAAGMGYVSDGFVYSCITRLLKTHFAIGSILLFIGFGDILSSQFVKVTNEVEGSRARWSATMDTLRNGFTIFGYGNSGVRNLANVGAYDSFTDQLSRYGFIFVVFLLNLLFRVFKKFPEISIIITLTLVSQNVWEMPLVSAFYFWSMQKPRLINKTNIQIN